MENMLSFIGKYNNNCKVYNSEITEEEISLRKNPQESPQPLGVG